jgi:glycosyltransferase involved in cell wall biosynthesis
MREATWAEVVHSHGLWVMPCVYPALAARLAGKPLVLSPRGTLSAVALARTGEVKRVFWALLQGPPCGAPHACMPRPSRNAMTSAMLGCGSHLRLCRTVSTFPPAIAAPKSSQFRTLLYLGRIHPIKGIDNLLRAWQRVAAQFPNWQLRLVGPDDSGYLTRIEQLMNELALQRVLRDRVMGSEASRVCRGRHVCPSVAYRELWDECG